MSRTNRLRHEQAQEDLDALADPCNTGQEAMLVQITSGESSAAVGYICYPISLRGEEAEGATPTFLTDTDTSFIAFNVGTGIPSIGTKVIVHSCGGRWVFRY